jgi:hypothetical protein
MVIVFAVPISLSRPGTIGQNEVEITICAIFSVVIKANELYNRPRLEPLVEDCGFGLKFKPDSALWVYANNL